MRALRYEYAKKPSALAEPIPDGQKPFHRAMRRLLVFEYQDKGGAVRQEILELPQSTFGEILTALERATGLSVKRP